MRNNANGQSLLEVLVALSAVLIILAAVTSIVISSLNQAVSSKEYSSATQHAQEGLAQVRGIDGITEGEFCLGENGELEDGLCIGANLGKYKRDVIIGSADCGGVLKKITVSVSWTDSTCKGEPFCRVVPVTSCE